MAQFLVKVADDRGHLAQQVEHGYSESEVRERFVQQGYLVYWVKPRGLFSGGKVELVASTQPNPAWIELDDQFVYFSTLGGEIFRVSKEGGTPVLLVPAKARPAIFLQCDSLASWHPW